VSAVLQHQILVQNHAKLVGIIMVITLVLSVKQGQVVVQILLLVHHVFLVITYRVVIV